MKKLTPAFPLLSLFVILFSLSGCADIANQKTIKPDIHTLRVGVTPNSPPNVYEINGQLVGLEIDFAQQLGAYLGKRVEFVKLDWQKLIPSLEENKIDIIMAGMTATPKRAYRVDFAKPYMRSGQILLVRNDDVNRYATGIFSLMRNQPRIGVIEDTTGDFYVTKVINKADLTRFKTAESAVKSLIKDKIDVIVHDAPILCYYAAQNEESVSPILQMATEEYLAWAVSKNNTQLLGKVNAFVDQQADSGALSATISKWIPYM